MTTTRWYIGDTSDPVIVEGHTDSFPNTTFGEEVTFSFYIRNKEITQDDNFDPANLTYTTGADRYNRLKDYLNYAGYSTTSQTMGSVYFTEPFDFTNSPVSTLLVPIWPHQDIDQARGVWGIITGGDDTTEIFGSIARIDLDVFVLAEYSDYSTESDVRNEFEATI